MSVETAPEPIVPRLFTVKLEKLVYGGDALGKLPDGRAVFVPFGLPGEEVRVEIIETKSTHARARLVEVVQPSPERIAPRCAHFGICGGCHYQHMDYASQLKVKENILRDQLERIGKIPNPPLLPIVPSPLEWNYRNHVQFHLTREGKLGFRAPHSNRLVPVSECHLPLPPLNDLWPKMEFEPNLGLERIALRVGAEDQAMLVLESTPGDVPELDIEMDISVVHLFEQDSLVISGDSAIEYVVMAGSDPALSKTFRVSAGSFFQVNTPMAGQMVGHLLSHLPATASTTLLEVYCGVGLFSAFLAPRVGRLIGIEFSSSACLDFTTNLDEFDNVELYEGDAGEILSSLEVPVDILLVDPPRAGLSSRVLSAIGKHQPKTLAYVSCDPPTLARDTAHLIRAGYQLAEITPFDLFPQTHSIECISIFKRRG